MSTKNDHFLSRSPSGKFGIHFTWGLLSSVLLTLLLAYLIMGLLNQELYILDQSITQFIQRFSSEPLTKVTILLTYLGSAYVDIGVFLVAGSYLLFRLKQHWDVVMLGSSLLGGWLLNLAMKAIFQRERPSIEHLVEVGGYSFPSGHAMVSTAFYGMLGYLLWLNLRKASRPSWYIIVCTVILILSIGISRVYLGVHFPSDILAGFAAGGLWLIACIFALHAIRPR